MPSVIWKLLISLPTGTAIILSFMKLLIFLINIPFGFMKLRIIAVPVGNEIKNFQMTLGIYFSLLGYFADCRQL